MALETTPQLKPNIAAGRIFETTSGLGIDGVLVTLYHISDLTGARYDGSEGMLAEAGMRLGSVMTDSDGAFRISYLVPGTPSQSANLAIAVFGPETADTKDDAPLYVTRRPRWNAAPSESFNVGIPGENLASTGLNPVPTSKARIDAYKRDFIAEKELTAEVTAFHKKTVDAEKTARAIFRSDLLKKVATDHSIATFPGEIATDGEIGDKNDKVTNTGVARANLAIKDAQGVPVTLYLTPDDRQRLAPFLNNPVDGFAEIPESELQDILYGRNTSENPGTLLINSNPIAQFCAEQTFEETCAVEQTGISPADVHSNGEDPHDDSGNDDEGSPDVASLSNANIPEYAAQILGGLSGQTEVVLPATLDQRLTKEGLEAKVDAFSLRVGPADVPAYYDFQSLQVAFDHVWKVLIDEQLVDKAQALDAQYKAKTGVSIASRFDGLWLDALATGDLVYENIPRQVPADILAQFDITLAEWTDLNASYQSKLREITAALNEDCTGKKNTSISIGGTKVNVSIPVSKYGTMACEKRRQDLREQGERIIDSVRHDDYYTLHRTLRDLKQQIDAGYEFTVFAANRTETAVNFGLLTEFRQEWVPISYQAGKLIKTIPLTAKEERRYAVKVKRVLKHGQNEAVKNNSSVTAEQASTSRVEAEIMAKAQAKTDFNLNAEGTYNIGISKGKSTTSFGVEAQKESSSSRKDFREAVMKATQEYKDERSIQIDTEDTETGEYSESGVIVNPNDELSVTYLFYELQRRYRVSESLHRVQPTVLVAQDVPAPHQITESWVIANDWIINRYLLDDSFRPALDYLRLKSVGDDFALRELRKNLRQQRNLVETLRIEFAMVSQEAESRYSALEGAIERRIGEEEAEDTDGWFSDIGDFFGGGGQSPEAAKARELAAKDAHQHALERAEKQGASLKQEMRTLHAITREYNDTLRGHLDHETRVKRLLVHIRKNIFHYMQGIWRMEPPDQRFMRLHKVRVPQIELATVPDPQNPNVQIADRRYFVEVAAREDIFAAFRPAGTTKHRAFMTGTMKKGAGTRSLVEVADLDNMLGFKGNYMIFPLKEHNALTEFMAAPYVDVAFGAMDPDELSNVSLQDYSKYVCCLHRKLGKTEFEKMRPTLKAWLEKLLADPLRNGEEIVVPSGSLFVETLPGTHPLLEDFKLRHRELDVRKSQNEVRQGGLEALRMAARLINDEREDPDVERKIVVEGGVLPNIDVDND